MCLHCDRAIEELYDTGHTYYEDRDGESHCESNPAKSKYGDPHEPAEEEY